MDALEILNHPAINRVEIARRLYPDLSEGSAKVKLAQKLSGYQNRRILEDEEERILQIWVDIKKEIELVTA